MRYYFKTLWQCTDKVRIIYLLGSYFVRPYSAILQPIKKGVFEKISGWILWGLPVETSWRSFISGTSLLLQESSHSTASHRLSSCKLSRPKQEIGQVISIIGLVIVYFGFTTLSLQMTYYCVVSFLLKYWLICLNRRNRNQIPLFLTFKIFMDANRVREMWMQFLLLE